VADTGATAQIGKARSPADAEALARFDQRMALPLIVSAVVPLFLLPGGAEPVLAAAVFIASWLVFLVDLVVHERRVVHYLGTWLGRFDLLVVVLTAPWFLIVGTGTGKFVILIRLARVARVVMATRGARRLFERLGAVALVAVGVVVVGAAVGYRAEHATNPEFKTFGDALWWAVVTLTTVGYGDVVPETTAGRVDGVMIMIAGVSVLGLLAGSMASFFGLGTSTSTSPTTRDSDETQSRSASASEIAELQTQVARLVDEVARLAPPHDGASGRASPQVPN
jgi:voltage-gated potassium channel